VRHSRQPGLLIGARFVQGAAGALSTSVILAIIATEFHDAHERARAMGAYIFVGVGGGSIGLLAGGILTQALNWHWILTGGYHLAFLAAAVWVAFGIVAAIFLVRPRRGVAHAGAGSRLDPSAESSQS